jgi:hypothetical protein
MPVTVPVAKIRPFPEGEKRHLLVCDETKYIRGDELYLADALNSKAGG